MAQATDRKEYERLCRVFGDLVYNEYLSVPVWSDYRLAGVNPKTVANYELSTWAGLNGMETVKKPK